MMKTKFEKQRNDLRKESPVMKNNNSNNIISIKEYVADLGSVRHLDIWLADIPLRSNTHIQGGPRPVVVVSNNETNRHSTVISVIPLTTNMKFQWMVSHVRLEGGGLRYPSLALIDQITTIDRSQLNHRIGHLDRPGEVAAIKVALLSYMNLTA